MRADIAASLSARGWHVRERVFGGDEWSFADRHNWARRGVLVAHLGFVIVAAGTTLYWARGFSGETAVLTGQAVEIPQTHAVLRLDSFGYKIQPIMTKSGMVYQPVDYVSRVTVTGNDGVARAETVRVNHPIDVDGTLYYQASYGFGMRFRVEHDGRPVPAAVGAHASRRRCARHSRYGTQRRVRALRPDGRPAKRHAVGRSARQRSGVDPRRRAGRKLARRSRSFRCIRGSMPANGWRVIPQRYVLYSGFQYRYDPGMPLVGIGAFVLLAGLIVSFYFLPARLFVRVDESGPHRARVGMAATTVKGYDVFENEFCRLVVALKPPDAGEPASRGVRH